MISLFRRFAKSWVAAILIGLLVISFAVFGINDVFTGTSTDAIIEADGRKITAREFAREFNNEREAAEQRVGQPISLDMAVERGFDRQVLEQLAGREAFAALIHSLGLRVSDEQVGAEISKIPAFFDSISGRFDRDLYASKLAERQYETEEYERLVRDEISVNHVMAAVASGLRAPRAYGAVGAVYALESRDLSFFVIDPRGVEQPKEPTDAELQAFMKENAAQLTRPEFRQITVARFSAAAMASQVTIDEEELRKRFEFRKDSLSRPELRTVVQISAQDAAGAAKVRRMLMAGADPSAAAGAVGAEPLTYAAKPRTAIVDRKVADVAFALDEGEVSQPIQGELGYAVAKVLDVQPGTTVTLADVRPELEAELRADAALAKAYAQTQAYEEAHASGAPLAEAARKAGVEPITPPPLTAQGQTQEGEAPELPEQLLKIAFDLPAGGESGIEEAERGEYFVVRVDKVIPAALPPLDEVRDQLTRVYMLRQLAERMEDKAAELAERVRKGESLAAVAASAGGRVNAVPGVSRVNARQFEALGADLLGKAFEAKKGEVFVARNPQFGFAVVRLDDVEPAATETVAPLVEAQRMQLTGELFQGIQASLIDYARRETRTRTNLDLARRAIGVDPATLPAPGAQTDETGQ